MRLQAIALLLISFTVIQVFAQTDLNARDPRLNEGSIFTINLSPKDKKLVVSLVGKPQAELGPDKVIVFGREIYPGGKSKAITIRPSGDHFEIIEPVRARVPIEIEVQDKQDKTKKEKFELRLN